MDEEDFFFLFKNNFFYSRGRIWNDDVLFSVTLKKPKINCAKKGDSGLDPSFKKEKDLVNIYDFGYMIILILCRPTIQNIESYCITNFFFSYFFSCFFKYVQKNTPMHEMSPVYVQKNSPMHETSPIVVVIDVLKQKIFDFKLKETRNSYFRVTPKNYRLMFFSWKMLKSTVTKKVIVCFYNFRWRKFLKVAAYVIFPTSIMPLFEICQTLKGHFLNELRVSFNDYNND